MYDTCLLHAAGRQVLFSFCDRDFRVAVDVEV